MSSCGSCSCCSRKVNFVESGQNQTCSLEEVRIRWMDLPTPTAAQDVIVEAMKVYRLSGIPYFKCSNPGEKSGRSNIHPLKMNMFDLKVMEFFQVRFISYIQQAPHFEVKHVKAWVDLVGEDMAG